MNIYLLLRFKWSNYTHAIEEAVHTLYLRPAFKVVSFVLVVMMLAQFPILKAFAGDAGTVPAQASDAQYTYYVHGDNLGSAHILTEGQSAGGKHVGIFYNQGDLIQRIEYNPYGQETYVLNPNLSFDPSFTGQTYDIESGLYYFNARYYNPQLGRFIQADTVVPSATDFQSYNRYAYARNNPLKYVDPSGHSWLSSFASFLGALVGIIVGIAVFALFVPAGGVLAMSAGELFTAAVVAGAAAGAAGGLVSGLIMGGIKGALIGMAMGAIVGAVSGGIAQAGGPVAVAVLMGAGLALSIKSEGWAGIGTFAAGLLGAYCGGQAMGVNIFSCFAKKAYVAQGGGKEFKLDLGFDPNFDPSIKPDITITAQRTWETGQSTISEFSVDGTKIGYFLEPPASGRIPAGAYSIGTHDTLKFPLGTSLELQNVSGHSGILMHVGNYPNDTSGCLLPGLSMAQDYVGSSQAAFNTIMNYYNNASSMMIVIHDWHPPMAVNPPIP